VSIAGGLLPILQAALPGVTQAGGLMIPRATASILTIGGHLL